MQNKTHNREGLQLLIFLDLCIAVVQLMQPLAFCIDADQVQTKKVLVPNRILCCTGVLLAQ